MQKAPHIKSVFEERMYSWTLRLLALVDKLPTRRSANAIASQLVRSGTSVGANFIEAQAASSKRDFANFLNHALKSANESKFWLALLRDTRSVTEQNVGPLLKELEELSKILGSSLITVRKNLK